MIYPLDDGNKVVYDSFSVAAKEIWEEFTTGTKTRRRRIEVEEEKMKREKDKLKPFIAGASVRKAEEKKGNGTSIPPPPSEPQPIVPKPRISSKTQYGQFTKQQVIISTRKDSVDKEPKGGSCGEIF